MRQWLKDIRKQRKATIFDVATRARMSCSEYSRIENGDSPMKVEQAKRIAAALGFDWHRFGEEAQFLGNVTRAYYTL